MSNRAKRATVPPRVSLEYVAGTTPIEAPAGPRAIRKQRARYDRRQAKLNRHAIRRPLAEADIPPGSVLADQTIADIRAGRYAVNLRPPPPSSPRRSDQPRRRQRRKMAKASRRQNRGR